MNTNEILSKINELVIELDNIPKSKFSKEDISFMETIEIMLSGMKWEKEK